MLLFLSLEIVQMLYFSWAHGHESLVESLEHEEADIWHENCLALLRKHS